uniref:Uncharacterized protein n=1 Tax=Hordeum vulgare subsp. vulgare TaxID=112509 RepID=A0A8I6XM35_HORVV
MTTAFVVYCRAKKVDTVRPWVTVLSGQLQRAYVTGILHCMCAYLLSYILFFGCTLTHDQSFFQVCLR